MHEGYNRSAEYLLQLKLKPSVGSELAEEEGMQT